MHLRAIKLRGFKSFPDPVEIRLEPGVAVVVGPNGSGKSNVADAIVWAAGSLAPHELRAEKPDDVLFSGSASRKAEDFCEVELSDPRAQARQLTEEPLRPLRRGCLQRQRTQPLPDFRLEIACAFDLRRHPREL